MSNASRFLALGFVAAATAMISTTTAQAQAAVAAEPAPPAAVAAQPTADEAPEKGGKAEKPRRQRTNRNMLTAEEISESTAMDVSELIRHQRPQWLRGRVGAGMGDAISVYVNGQRVGGPDALRNVEKSSVEAMRYYEASAAQMRFGLNNRQGAIHIVTKGFRGEP